MVRFDPRRPEQGPAFAFEQARLKALVADMDKIGAGASPEDLVGDVPLLDHWLVDQRPIPCLTGMATGHPRLVGQGRPIITSDLWLISEDRRWARTLSRWYRLGRPAGSARDTP